MSSKARQKIDPTVRDMFDAEVDSPDHDRVVVALFQNESALLGLIATEYAVSELPDFTEQSRFRLHDESDKAGWISYADAIQKTGVVPTWSDRSSIRVAKKQLEAPLLLPNGTGRTSRVVGFIDLAVTFLSVGNPTVYRFRDGVHQWQRNEETMTLLVEVKAKWPTVGNLLRQLNLYSMSAPHTFTGDIVKFVVGPDDSMSEMLSQHAYRLATFDAGLEHFAAIDTNTATQLTPRPGAF
ncbi:MAG: hypothetical protein Q8M35_06785 [Pseudohongiella sp.]|nr:hypothetical protein [Pseudohongiella sp.]